MKALTDENRGQYQWIILVAIFGVHVLTAVGMFSIQLLVPVIKPDLHLNHTQVGVLVASYFLGVSLMSTFAGLIVDSFGVSKAVVFGAILVGCSLIAAAWLPILSVMMIFLVLAGAGYSVITPSTNKAVMYWFKENIRATTMGLKQTGINGGGFLAGLIIPPLALILGWHLALTAAGLIVMGAVMMVVFLYREAEQEGGRSRRFSEWSSQIREVIGNRNVLLLAVEGFFRVGVQMAFLTYLMLFLQKAVNLKLVLASFLFAIVQLSGAAGRIAWGFFSDRLVTSRRVVYIIIGLMAAICFYILGQVGLLTPMWVVSLTAVFLGLTAVGHQGVGLTLLGECAGHELTGTASGFGQSLFFLGVVLLSPGFGFVVDTFGSFAYAWRGLGFVSLICCATLCFVREAPKSRDKEVILTESTVAKSE